MTQDKRKFSSTTKSVKLELSPAEIYGGPEGHVRIRVERRWVDGFYTAEGVGALVAQIASSAVLQHAHPPDLPCGTWVKVDIPDDDEFMPCTTKIVNKAPIRLFDGAFYVLVHVPRYGFILVPSYDVKKVSKKEALYKKLHQ